MPSGLVIAKRGRLRQSDAAGHRGRGIAEGRAIEEELVLEAVVEVGRLRLGGVGDTGELGKASGFSAEWPRSRLS